MTTTVFVNGVTLTDDGWFNDVDALRYDSGGSQYTSFLPSGTGFVARTANAKMADVVDPIDYGGTGEKQPIRLARMNCEFYDDFLRANTSAGSLGTPAMGTTWQMLGPNTAAPAVVTNISGCRYVSAAGDVCYATQTLTGNVTKMGMTVSWVTGNAGSDEGVAAMLIGPTQAAGSLALNLALHLIIHRTSWALQTYTTGTPTTVASGSFSPTLSLNTPYTFEVTFGRNTAHYKFPQGFVGDCTSAAFTANAGKYATWEHFYASSSVVDLVRFEAVWAGTSPYPLSSIYEDLGGVVYQGGVPLSKFETLTRTWYTGGSGGISILDSTGVVGLMTISDAGVLGLTKGQISFPATQNPSANVNTLDDYEEGAWTPVLAGSSTAGTQTYTLQAAVYTKIGRFVAFQGNIVLSAKDAATAGNLRITGLPFANNGNVAAVVNIGYTAGLDLDIAGGYYKAIGNIASSAQIIELYEVGDNNSGALLTAADFGAATNIYFSGHYTV